MYEWSCNKALSSVSNPSSSRKTRVVYFYTNKILKKSLLIFFPLNWVKKISKHRII